MDASFILGLIGGAVIGLIGGAIPGGVVGAIFLGYDEAKAWEAKYWAEVAKKQETRLEVTLRKPDGGRSVVALHNLTAVDSYRYLQALQAVAEGRPFTVRFMAFLLTADEVKAMREELASFGYLVNRGEKKAPEWTTQGEALLDEVRTSPTAHLLPSVFRGTEQTVTDRLPVAAFERPYTMRKKERHAV